MTTPVHVRIICDAGVDDVTVNSVQPGSLYRVSLCVCVCNCSRASRSGSNSGRVLLKLGAYVVSPPPPWSASVSPTPPITDTGEPSASG